MLTRGHTNGRWGTMVTISPGSPKWAEEVRWGWQWRQALGRARQRLFPHAKQQEDVRNLTNLSMIGFARWSMIDHIPAGVEKQQATRLRRPFLLFETNFNGDFDAYFEAFSYVVPKPMNRVWDKAYDVPSVQRVSEWQRVINERSLPIAYYYSAYPDASTKMIRTALVFERMLAEFRMQAANMTSEQFDTTFRALLGRVTRIQYPKLPRRVPATESLTTLIPIDQRRRGRLKESLKDLERPPAPLPMTTHFARWCVVKQLDMPARFGVDPTSYLLFTAWFDGNRDDYAAALYQQLGPERAKAIWRNCGFKGGSAEEFANHLMRYSVKSDSHFEGYNGVPVDEVRRALGLRDHFDDFARATQALSGPALQTAWVNDPVLSRGT